ncbi:EcKinase domain containing protein [Asbolus verrucosus]|uniref:EcKinase domain containing protein n=1 Tax=Asbolus verrucosus TaxID=1661398 RepID=A0A482VXX7_ASBVE|nr:EcKinase domain containing protein [Asbolus verrucosus]
MEIKHLKSLFAPILNEDLYVDAKISRLTNAGDNYGSLILAVDIKTRNRQKEYIHAVAKMLPFNEIIQKMFNSSYTFRNEIAFYEIVAPCLRDFQKFHGLTNFINCFPSFYAARMNLDPISGKIDEDTVLLIENLKYEGYTTINRTVGFDLDQSKLILDKLAEMHGTSMALKLQEPEIFDRKLRPFLEEFEVFKYDDEANDNMVQSIVNIIKDDEICGHHLTKITQILHNNTKNTSKKNCNKVHKSPFLGIVHGDMWINNIMVKIVHNKTIDIKFVDYQLYEYTCLAREIVFFLFTSVQTSVLQSHCDTLLTHYYNNLMYWLQRLKCSLALSFDTFMNDLKNMLQQAEFFNVMIMLAPIYATEGDTKEIEEISMDNLTHHKNEVTEAHKEKACFIVREFLRRDWI